MVFILFLLKGKSQRTMTICVASLLGGILGYGHRLFLSHYWPKCYKSYVAAHSGTTACRTMLSQCRSRLALTPPNSYHRKNGLHIKFSKILLCNLCYALKIITYFCSLKIFGWALLEFRICGPKRKGTSSQSTRPERDSRYIKIFLQNIPM